MSQATLSNIIIEKIEKNVDLQQLALEFPWMSLSFSDKEDLFHRVDTWRDDPKVKALLRYIVSASKDDITGSTKAYILAFSNPQFKEDRDRIEKACDKFLEELRDQIKDSDPEGVRRYQFFLADFHGIKAGFLFDDGKLQQAKS